MPETEITLAGDPSAPIRWTHLLQSFHPERLFIRFLPDFWEILPPGRVPDYAAQLARIRVLDATRQVLNDHPFPMELKYEERNLRAEGERKIGPVYSGLHFLGLCRKVLQESGARMSEILRTVVVTHQRLGTYETGRWHLRTILLGGPVVISVTGFVEAPAKPREYYLLKQTSEVLALEFLKTKTAWLTHNDPRLTPVLRSFVLKAVAFILDPVRFTFCSSKECVMSDPHWQSDLIRTHAPDSVPFCARHAPLSRFLRSSD